jgi:hypothetical protein
MFNYITIYLLCLMVFYVYQFYSLYNIYYKMTSNVILDNIIQYDTYDIYEPYKNNNLRYWFLIK